MAAGRKVMSNAGVAAALVALLVAAAATGAAGDGINICGINTDRLSNECRSYCKVGSTDSQPSGPCCTAVKYAQYGCLCRFQNVLPSDIDPHRAMEIPAKCVAGAPSKCN